jgi:hypothetical protein
MGPADHFDVTLGGYGLGWEWTSIESPALPVGIQATHRNRNQA